MSEPALPTFTSHGGNIKLRSLEEGPREPSQVVRRMVDAAHRRSGVAAGSFRVLDVGCGRGDMVAWLCERGFDAYGVDVDHWHEERIAGDPCVPG